MPLNYPDILQHNNSSYPIIDSNNILGSVFVTGSNGEQYGISEYKRKLGMIVYFSSSQNYKYYKGGTTSSADWSAPSSWSMFGGTTYLEGPGIDINSNYISASLGAGLEFDNDSKIQARVRSVNGAGPNTSGNVVTGLTEVYVGDSASLIASSSGDITASFTNGAVWTIANDATVPSPNGLGYIFKSGSGGVGGQWYPLATLNQTQADYRYVKLISNTTQNITSSLIISGSSVTFSSSIYWVSKSFANIPPSTVSASVVVLGDDNKLYITGAYGAGGSGTPGGADTTIQFNDGGSTFSGSGTFTFNKTSNTVNISGSLIVTGSTILSSSLQVIGTGSITGSLIVSNSLNIIGTGLVTGSLIVSNSLNVIGISRVTGSLIVSKSTDNAAIIVGSGSTNPLLNVLGSQGQLFSVYDTLSGSLFSVNDISGLPILEVKSDITTLIGSYQAPALHTSRRIVTAVGSNIIYNGIPTSSYNAAIIDYNLTSASYAKVGSIMTAWSGSIITAQTEYATASVALGNYPTMSLFISGANLVITASAASANWIIKTIIRSI
jgi:hypothetical protein